jgi:glucose/arabinose dehydrogenase
MRRIALLGLLAPVLAIAPAASAATLQPVGNFVNPIFVTSYPDDAGKLLVVERAGRVQLRQGGTTSTFLDARSLVGTVDGERGMWSIALAPDFSSTGKLYAFYAGSATGGDQQLDEFTAVGDTVSLSTRRPVLTIEHSESGNHNGGQLQFGPDGYLYVSTGDGNRRAINSQELTNPLGKILRIDPRQSGGEPYSVPSDNPFVGSPGAVPEIWSYGLRNPWRFSFDRLAGSLLIGDVGRQRFEEVDYDPSPNPGRGDNYGWPCFEAFEVRNTTDGACRTIDPADVVFPIHAYDHTGKCSITGGYVARDPSLGDVYGRYLYIDLCEGQVRSLVPQLPQATDDRAEGIAVPNAVSFGEDACRRLYIASIAGAVSRFIGDAPGNCGAGLGDVVGGVLHVDAGVGVANKIVVTASGPNWIVRDDAGPLVAGPACAQLAANRISCPQASVTSVAVEAGDLNDKVTAPNGLPASVDGGDGDDQLTTGNGPDSLFGGLGRDKLDGGAGPDLGDGGPGKDTYAYGGRTAAQPVLVSLDGVADDGGAVDGGGDNVLPSTENLIGGAGGDTLTGNDLQNVLTGGAGPDQLHGLGANDTVQAKGDGSNDTINCGAGPKDVVFPDPGDAFPVSGPDACELVR